MTLRSSAYYRRIQEVVFNKIATNLGIAVETVNSRIKHLEDEGVLKDYRVIVDPNLV